MAMAVSVPCERRRNGRRCLGVAKELPLRLLSGALSEELRPALRIGRLARRDDEDAVVRGILHAEQAAQDRRKSLAVRRRLDRLTNAGMAAATTPPSSSPARDLRAP